MGRRRRSNLHLPERVYLVCGSYYYVPKASRKIRIGKTIGEAEQALRRIGREPARMSESHLRVIFWNAKKNAKSRGIPFDLTRTDLEFLWRRSGGRCELTYLPFDLLNVSGCRRRSQAPSIDRIDGSKGYTIDNCRLILVLLNLAINEWGEEAFARVARAYLKYQETRRQR